VWNFWLILAGRGWGKTRTGAQDIIEYALLNDNVNCAVVTPTFGDLKRVAFGGVSGIMALIPRQCLLQGRGQGFSSSNQEIRLKNGSKIIGFSATEPDRLRGPQFHRAWCDELAAWRYPESFDQLLFGLRLGTNPQCVITTTPKPTDLIRNLLERDDVHITRGSTFDNAANLAPSALAALEERYAGTTLGRQELYAELVEDVEGALFSRADIEHTRVPEAQLPEMTRVVVGVDPAVTNNAHSDETGIIVAGRGIDRRLYVIDDVSQKNTPDGWMREAVRAYYRHEADRIVVEVNNGGDLVGNLLSTIDKSVPLRSVRATRGKMIRAEPIAALYEQKKVSHCGIFAKLEEQMCFYSGDGKSPDRLDALVWALTELSRSDGQAQWRVS
jgi:phage terminase large subunit-like protein